MAVVLAAATFIGSSHNYHSSGHNGSHSNDKSNNDRSRSCGFHGNRTTRVMTPALATACRTTSAAGALILEREPHEVVITR